MNDEDRTLWLIDDDQADHTMFTRAFATHGVKVIGYFSAEEALEALANGAHPRLALLDIRMPGMGGFYFLEERRNAGLLHAPVAMLSSSTDPEDVARAYAMGAAAYLPKPADYAGLMRFAELVSAYWFELAELPRPDLPAPS